MKDKTHKFGYHFFVLFGNTGFAHKTGQENDPKFWKNEEPDMGASGTLVTRLSRDIVDLKIRNCILIDITNHCICSNRQLSVLAQHSETQFETEDF